jgi:hypothetical protein
MQSTTRGGKDPKFPPSMINWRVDDGSVNIVMIEDAAWQCKVGRATTDCNGTPTVQSATTNYSPIGAARRAVLEANGKETMHCDLRRLQCSYIRCSSPTVQCRVA